MHSRPWDMIQVSSKGVTPQLNVLLGRSQCHIPAGCTAGERVPATQLNGPHIQSGQGNKLCPITFNMFILPLLEFLPFSSHTLYHMCARLIKMGRLKRTVLPLVRGKTQIQ
jgi:hypothetical protein